MLKTITEFPNYKVNEDGQIFSIRSNNFICQKVDNHGYVVVRFYDHSKITHRKVHTVVASTFLEKKTGLEVNHIDGDKTNNKLSNLEYVTSSQNKIHAYKIGLRGPVNVKGAKHHLSKISRKDATEIKKLLAAGIGVIAIAKGFKTSVNPIYQIKYGKHWTCKKEVENAHQ